MSSPTRPRASKRERRIHAALVAVVIGTVGLTGLALWVRGERDTDLADSSASVTSSFLGQDGKASPLRFTDVAAEVGLDLRHGPGERSRTLPEDTGSGLAWGDVDGDGDFDLYVVNFPAPDGSGGANRLYRNDGGRFIDVTERAGVADADGFGMGASFVDYDGDGALDLYVTNRGPNRLFRGRGDGTFAEVGAAAGVDDDAWSTGIAWGDYDRDGHVDLFVCNYVRYEVGVIAPEDVDDVAVPYHLNPNSFDPQPNRLYRNLGDGTFEDVAPALGVDDPAGRSLAATFCDLDGDGWLDLYVNNDVSTNRLYRNALVAEGRGFKDVGLVTGTADPRGSMGLSVGEIGATSGTPDGLPDMFITHWVAQENALYESHTTGRGVLEFRDRTRRLRLGEISIERVGWGCVLADLDLDGRVDLAVANGSTLESKATRTRLRAEPLFLFWSDGTNFVEVAAGAGPACAALYTARGLAAADYDGDGDVDLAISVNRGRPLLLRNDTPRVNQALAVRLDGPAAALFGARVEVVTEARTQTQWYGADVSYLSMHAPELIFGLGTETTVAELNVTWADGRTTQRRGLASGRVVLSPAN